jgi:anti-sigma-K factor RskA
MDSETHVTEMLAAYALNILDATEASHIEAHLAGCLSCQQELTTYQELIGLLALAAPAVTPPPSAKRQLMAQIEIGELGESVKTASTPSRGQAVTVLKVEAPWWQNWRNWFTKRPIWQPVFVIAMFLLFISNFQLRQRLDDANHPARFGTVTLSSTEVSQTATGLVIISEDGEHGTLIVQDLPTLDESETYQIWLIKNSQPTAGAIFNVDETGYRAVWLKSPEPLANYNNFAITIEPAEGSANPTGEKVLSN